MDKNSSKLETLIGHTLSIQAKVTVGETYQVFSEFDQDYMAVLDGKKLLGICSRNEIGMLLGSMFGRALNVDEPITNHIMKNALSISTDQNIPEILNTVFSRQAEQFYNDVALTETDGTFLGMIFVQDLVKLQHTILDNILEHAKAFSSEQSFSDDVCMVALNVTDNTTATDSGPTAPPSESPFKIGA